MTKSTKGTLLPRKVAQNLATVGEQIRLARLRRNLSIADIAARATCSELSVMRVERGAASVAMGIYLRVLYALQLDEDILLLAQKDEIGRSLQDLDMKQRKRSSSRKI